MRPGKINFLKRCAQSTCEGFQLLVMVMLLFVMNNVASAQRVDFTYETYGLEVDADNVIQNVAHLDAFYESLYQQHLHNDRKINIMHIGDSHVQADYMTSVVRRNFHRDFG